MKIQTGRGTIPLITLIAIWSISALTSLPGLAVSPILGDLTKIFPKATDLDIQMLTSLPSLLIIPFILLGGKLTEKVDFVRILKIGLWLFAASGILYLISNKMWQLIVVSALLGIGSGLIIPLSTGLISKYFVGTYRVKQFGLSSAITNFTLVIATAVTGYLAEVSWHLPFLVYLLPLISILLVGHLKESRSDAAVKPSSQSTAPSGQTAAVDTGGSKYGIHIKHLLQIMLFYGVTTFIVLAVIFNLSFLMEKHHFSSGNSGLMISLFFLAIMAPGFCLDKIVDELKERTKAYSLLSMAVGLALIWIAPIEWLIIPGCILVGLGYGIIQPMLYDKTTHTALPQKATMALAFVMMMNYLAILLYPFYYRFSPKSVSYPVAGVSFYLQFVDNYCYILLGLPATRYLFV